MSEMENPLFSTSQGFIWLFSLFTSVLGTYLYFSEKVSGYRTGIGSWVWWYGFPWFMYAVSVGVLCVVIAILFFKYWRYGSLSIVSGAVALISGTLWFGHVYLFREAQDLPTLALSYVIWCAGAITLGLTMILTGLFYEAHSTGNSNITHLTSVTFLIAGMFSIVIGYVGGFTLLPYITVFDVPLVSIVTSFPSVAGVVHHSRLGRALEQ